MEKEYEYLLHLLGAFLRQEAPEVRQDVDWTRLVQLSQIHCVTGIVGYMSMAHPICPDEQMKTALRSVCVNTIGLFARRGALADEFVAMLEEAQIDHILMKGYVLRDYYPVPELRTYGDIDIVIRPEDREKCHELMLSQGYHVETDWEPVFSYAKDCEYYEIHAQIMEVDVSDKANYRAYFSGMWQYARPVGNHDYRFAPEYHFLYLLTHIAKHVTGSGAGVRMYLDVAAFVRHFGKELDWNFVEKELEKLHFGEFSNVVLTMVQECFGVESPLELTPVSGDVWKEFMDFTMAGGVFGKASGDSGTNSLKKESRSNDHASKLGTFAKRLFPSAKTIETRYTYLQGRPWLLPAAWVHRLVKTRGTWKQHAREAQDIMSADMEEVQKLKWLCEEIGL